MGMAKKIALGFIGLLAAIMGANLLKQSTIDSAQTGKDVNAEVLNGK